jgi:hypothetical protein
LGGDELIRGRRGRSDVKSKGGGVDILRCGVMRGVGIVMMEGVEMGMSEDDHVYSLVQSVYA